MLVYVHCCTCVVMDVFHSVVLPEAVSEMANSIVVAFKLQVGGLDCLDAQTKAACMAKVWSMMLFLPAFVCQKCCVCNAGCLQIKATVLNL